MKSTRFVVINSTSIENRKIFEPEVSKAIFSRGSCYKTTLRRLIFSLLHFWGSMLEKLRRAISRNSFAADRISYSTKVLLFGRF